MSRIVALTWTARVAPGLLSASAWHELHAADMVLAGMASNAQVDAIRAAGVKIEAIPVTDVRAGVAAVRNAATDGTVVWICDGGRSDPVAQALQDAGLGVEVLPGSWDRPGSRLLDAVDLMDTLRSPGGCAWDAEQTHQSLAEYLLEETYEVLEQIDTGDRTGLREELGDVLLQVLFHSRIATEDSTAPFDIDDVAGQMVDKLVARHPHVFGDDSARTADEVALHWEARKRVEKGRSSAVDGVPMAMPALALSAKLLRRARKFDVDVPVADPQTTASASVALTKVQSHERLGDLLFAVVAAADPLDAEAALRGATRRFAAAVRETESEQFLESGSAGAVEA